MPLPLLFIGIAAATGLAGAGKTVKAVVDNTNANKINTAANEGVDNARKRLEQQRGAVAQSLEKLGEEKLRILAGTVTSFVSAFEKIKNIDFTSSVGLEELEKLDLSAVTKFKRGKDGAVELKFIDRLSALKWLMEQTGEDPRAERLYRALEQTAGEEK